jgi:hypothetical protein
LNIGFLSNCIVDDISKKSPVPLTQQEIANLLGTNKSKISKIVTFIAVFLILYVTKYPYISFILNVNILKVFPFLQKNSNLSFVLNYIFIEMEEIFMKKVFFYVLSFAVLLTGLIASPSNSSAASSWVDLGSGYKARLDSPHGTANPKYHVHVYKNGKQVGAENMDGTKSHGTTLGNVPNTIKKKLKSTTAYKNHKKKHDKLQDQKSKAKKINWLNPWDSITLIVAVAVAAGMTFYSLTMSGWKKFIFS